VEGDGGLERVHAREIAGRAGTTVVREMTHRAEQEEAAP
jgi:hypothetical protein